MIKHTLIYFSFKSYNLAIQNLVLTNLHLLHFHRSKVLDEDNCQAISDEVGTHFLHKLNHLKTKYQCIGDVRGKGLMIGIEMVKDRVSYIFQ